MTKAEDMMEVANRIAADLGQPKPYKDAKMTTIKATATEDIRSGDLALLDMQTLRVIRYVASDWVDEDQALGVARLDINAGDTIIMDLSTGRITKDGEDVIVQTNK